MNSPISYPRTIASVPGILTPPGFYPEREIADAHWEAVRANGHGVHASQPLSLPEPTMTADWRRHRVSV